MAPFDQEVYMEGFIGAYSLENWWTHDLSDHERKIIESTYKPIGLPEGSDNLTKGRMAVINQSKLSFLSGLATWFKKPETFQLARKIIEYANNFINETTNIIDVHFYYQNRIEIFYRNRDNDPDALSLAIKACEDQISIAKEVAKALQRESREINDPIKQLERLIQMDKDLILQIPELRDSYEKKILDNENKLEKLKDKVNNIGISENHIKLPIHIGYKQLSIIKDKQKEYEEVVKICVQAKEEGWSGDWDKRIEKAKKKAV
jgi:hypothetical protein